FVTWSVAEGRMPPGVSLEADSGIIRGVPLESGRFSFRVRARDEAGFSDINGYTIEVLSQPLSIVTQDVPPAQVGEAYEHFFQMLPGSGRAPYAWTLLSGVLPDGFSLDEETGSLSGTPVEGSEGIYTFGLRVEDASGAQGMRAYVLEVRSSETDASLAVQPEPAGGCHSTPGAWPLAGALLAIAALLMIRRRCVAGAALALLLLLPGQAWSQSWSYSHSLVQTPYEEVSGTTLTDITGTWDGNTLVSLPFDFEFYGETYDQMTVSVNGVVGFEAFTESHYSNHSIPSSSNPNAIVALWWDDLDARGSGPDISTATLGQAPNRVFVVQWKNVVRSGGYLNFQLRLYEGTTTVEVRYGSFTGSVSTSSASAGIEDASGSEGLPGLACTPNCGQADFPSDHAIIYGTLPNLVASSVTAPATVWSGVPAQVTGTVANFGGEDAGPFDVVAVIADTPEEILDGQIMGSARVEQGLAIGEEADVAMIAEIPEDVLSEQDYWVSIIPNPDGEVQEAGSGSNYAPPVKVRVGPPMPNLRVRHVTPQAAEVSAGEELTVSYELANSGNLDADTSYWIVMSTNETITIQDVLLHEAQILLEARSEVVDETTLVIPEDIRTGSYYLGVILDPEGQVFEPDVTGNARASDEPVIVTGGEVAIVTSSLPPGRVGRPYEAKLEAAGGSEAYRFTVPGGGLPAGLTLSEDGWICGEPQESGEFDFQVLLRSGGLLAVRSFSILVDQDTTDLTVVSGILPGGAVGFEYDAALYAVGGTPPYAWRMSEGASLPEGLALNLDGRLEGVPREPGTHDIVVEVEDAEGQVAEAALDLDVSESTQLMVTTMDLPQGLLGEEYLGKLQATGGHEPYRWALDGTGRLPEGLSLSGEGSIEGTPEEVGVFDLVVTVRDDRGNTNSNTLSMVVGYSRGMSITTRSLPQATGGWDYEAALQVWGGTAPYTWVLVSGSLPSGLSLDEEKGVISGMAVDDGVSRHVPFIIEARDSVGRSAMRALSITVGPPPPVTEPEGCATAGGAAGTAILLLAALLFPWLSRRRRAGAQTITLVLAVVGLSFSGCSGEDLCEGVACPSGTVC
ncbi:MAG: putative Ig domain-containing protein, partial [Myxococcota bacterium]